MNYLSIRGTMGILLRIFVSCVLLKYAYAQYHVECYVQYHVQHHVQCYAECHAQYYVI